jgi:hypothetical protein
MNNLVSEAYDNDTNNVKKRQGSGISNELNQHSKNRNKNISNDAGMSSSMVSEKIDVRGQAGTQKNIKFKNKFGENRSTSN